MSKIKEIKFSERKQEKEKFEDAEIYVVERFDGTDTGLVFVGCYGVIYVGKDGSLSYSERDYLSGSRRIIAKVTGRVRIIVDWGSGTFCSTYNYYLNTKKSENR